MKVPKVNHVVKKGENLTKICKARGFATGSWKKIYKAPYNKALRKTNPDPNLIRPGDVIVVPILSKTAIIAIVKEIWVVIYAINDTEELYKLVLKDLATAKKKVSKDEEIKLAPLRKLTLKIIKADVASDKLFADCRAVAKIGPFPDYMIRCEKTHKTKKKIDMRYLDYALNQMEKQEVIAELKIKAIKASEVLVTNKIKALEATIQELQGIALFIGKTSLDSF